MEIFYEFFKTKFKSICESLIYKPVIHDEIMREVLHKDAHQLIVDAKLFIATGKTTTNLQTRLDLLINQDNSLSTYEALEILLDHAERILRA